MNPGVLPTSRSQQKEEVPASKAVNDMPAREACQECSVSWKSREHRSYRKKAVSRLKCCKASNEKRTLDLTRQGLLVVFKRIVSMEWWEQKSN